MMRKEVDKILEKILSDEIRDSWLKENNDKKLLGAEIGISARNLLVIYCELEKQLNIKIPQDAIINGFFDTYNHILDTLVHSEDGHISED